MDPSLFLQYSPPNGLPQESKLVTYMNRSAATAMRPNIHTMAKLSIESSPTANKKIMMTEFVPSAYYSTTPVLPDSPGSSPPNLNASSSNTQVHQENVGGTTYFYATKTDGHTQAGVVNSTQSLAGTSGYQQLYAGTPTHVKPIQPMTGLASTYYAPENIAIEINQRNQNLYIQPDVLQYPGIPESVETYGELVPLEAPNPHGSLTSSYRVTSRTDGQHRAMRRLHNYATSNATRQLSQWKKLDHSNVVRLLEFFTTKAFNDHSMVFIYEHHAGSETMQQKYMTNTIHDGQASTSGMATYDPFSADPDAPRPYTHQKNAMLRAVACGTLLPESVLWSILVQLTAGLRTIHISGLACRNLDPTKLIITGCRVRFAWCGTADALTPNSGNATSTNEIQQAQQEDLTALGRVALSLACRSMNAATRENLQASIELISRNYSPDFNNFITYLLATTPNRRSVADLMPMIGARFFNQVEILQRRADYTEQELAKEVDNGRLLKLLMKFGMINDRPELNMDLSWDETGDRYMLKLFRDYLFHSVTADGRPWVDSAHVVYNLNQLDAGTEKRVTLMSRDQESVLLVTYKELKHCLEQACEEVLQAAEATPPS